MLTDEQRQIIKNDPYYLNLRGLSEEKQEFYLKYCAKYILLKGISI